MQIRPAILTEKFFDNAWKGTREGKGVSANYEFVEAAKEAGFPLRTAILGVRLSNSRGNYSHIAEVPFITMQGSWDPFSATCWDGIIPLNIDEFTFIEEDG